MVVPPRPLSPRLAGPWVHPKQKLKWAEVGGSLGCFLECKQDVGKDRVPISSLLVHHLPEHPFQHLVKAFDEAVCLGGGRQLS